MKHFIQLTSICGNTRAFRVDSILQVVKQKVFKENEYKELPELKERTEWVYINQQCDPSFFYVRESYEEVMRMIEESYTSEGSNEPEAKPASKKPR